MQTTTPHDDSRLFESLVADAQEGVMILRPDGQVSYANPAAEVLLGRGRDELTGEMFGLPRADPGRPIAVNVVSGDGRLRMAEFRAEPLSSGPSGCVVVRLKDVTSYHDDVSDAREQVRRRDEFLAMLSHEVRNPLAAIRSASTLLAREGVPAEMRRAAGEILDRQFAHLSRILDDLLDVARISRGKLEIVRSTVELRQAVRDAVEEAADLLRKRGHAIRVEMPAHEVWVEGDATRLEQAVVNLLNNAAKFTPPGGVVRVSLAVADGQAEVCVRDDGPGVPEHLRASVFDPFVQGEQQADRGDGGLGIGLALVRTIAELHGGAARVEANGDGRGACFTIALPAMAAGPACVAEAPARPAARGLRVLLVEDADDARRPLRQLLEMDGHAVREAGDGPSGLAALLEGWADVALIDVGLPGLDGYEVARRARAAGCAATLAAATGYGMPADVRRGREAGFDAHLIKPLRYPDVCDLLARRRGGPADGD